MIHPVALFALGAAHDPLGPGPRSWPRVDPAEVGLSAARLAAAAAEVGATHGSPLCLTVIKDGALVLDEAYGAFATGGQQRRPIETMSAGKTATALLMGVAHSRGLFDLDTPLASYGVEPGANWSRRGGSMSVRSAVA